MMYDYKLHLAIRTPRACPWEQSGDYHVHTIYSDDSVYEMEEVVKDGIKRDVDDPLGPVYLNGQPITNMDNP